MRAAMPRSSRPDAPVPAESRAYGYYDRMIEVLEREGPAGSLPAVAVVLEHIAGSVGSRAAPTFAHAVETFLAADTIDGAWSAGTPPSTARP
jgi:hypothetical protein